MANYVESRPLALLFLDTEGVLIKHTSPRSPEKVAAYVREIQAECPEYANPFLIPPSEAPKLLALRARARCLSPSAARNLDILIENLEESMRVAIVITSLWREEMSGEQLRKHIFRDYSFHKYIIDKIPDSHATEVRQRHFKKVPASKKTHSDHCMEKYGFNLIHRRGRSIDYWLREHCESVDVHSFVIIDASKGDAFSTEIKARYPEHFVSIDANKLFTIEDARRCFDILNNPFSRQFPDQETIHRRCTIDNLRLKHNLELIDIPAYDSTSSIKRTRSRSSDL